jgi:hypothetical protein
LALLLRTLAVFATRDGFTGAAKPAVVVSSVPAKAVLIMMGRTGANLSKSFTTAYGEVSFGVGVGVRYRRMSVFAAVLDVTVANIQLRGMSA